MKKSEQIVLSLETFSMCLCTQHRLFPETEFSLLPSTSFLLLFLLFIYKQKIKVHGHRANTHILIHTHGQAHTEQKEFLHIRNTQQLQPLEMDFIRSLALQNNNNRAVKSYCSNRHTHTHAANFNCNLSQEQQFNNNTKIYLHTLASGGRCGFRLQLFAQMRRQTFKVSRISECVLSES